jgi:hypothetical protein
MACAKCRQGRNAHSLENLGTLPNGVRVFYTCPARRDDFNDNDFLTDFSQHLQATEGKPWIWLFDCQDYEAKHMLSLKDSMGLLRLFETTYKDSLQGMYVVNEAWYFHLFLKTVKPFMKAETKAKLHQITGSSLEAAVQLGKEGIPFSISKRIREPIKRRL